MEVEPLIVYSRAWIDRPLARRKGVRVLPARMLAGYLDRRRATLSPEQVQQRARARWRTRCASTARAKAVGRSADAPSDRRRADGRRRTGQTDMTR